MLGEIILWNSDLRQVDSCKPTSRSCSLCGSSAGFLTCFTWNFAFPLIVQQWLAECSWFAETYSSGYCTGFSPVSLSRLSNENRSPKNQRQKYEKFQFAKSFFRLGVET